MLNITDLKKGTVFVQNNEPFKVVEYSQKVMGRGGSIVSVKIKSLVNGKVLERTFKGNEQVESADVSSRSVQYLYNDGDKYFFMDYATFEQFEVPVDLVADAVGYIKEGDNVQLLFFKAQPISLDLPKNVSLRVSYAESAVKGDTSTAVTKDAELETGLRIKVPAFIKTGDVVSVDTATGDYRERVKS
ncbi:elongation factor P [Patescibacteria group bacterium]|nr:elongation factor P [Patescibacteria group bacterium]